MYCEVIIDVAASDLDKIFDYIAIPGVFVGSRVVVPFGRSFTEGFVMALKSESAVPENKLKSIARVVEDIPALSEEALKLAKFVREKYHVSYAAALRLLLPSEMRTGKVRKKTVRVARLAENLDVNAALSAIRKGADMQAAILKRLSKVESELTARLNENYSSTALNALIKRGFVTVSEERVGRVPYSGKGEKEDYFPLTSEQQAAYKIAIESDKPTLIHGVTGSGKTEVYLNLIKTVLNEGKTAIMLVPEISLTPQTLMRLRSRFGDSCAILHSGLSAGEKFDEWWRLRSGEAKIAVGARSAVFAPLENPGIIIIDEEHDGSYESESSPRYVTGEVAEYRAKLNGAKLVMGSATPKIETYLKATQGEYSLAEMVNRVNGKPMPEVIIADMKEEVRSGNPSAFSSALKYELKKTLDDKNQAMIFLNRRGYSQKLICADCGFVAKCEHCDVALTYHREEGALKCHYCGAAYKMPAACPECGGVKINYSGTGTERVVKELKELYPQANILRMDNDTTRNKESHFNILTAFGEKKADILVGTQMIAKGHDFKNVTLVGIIDADMSLYFSDYRSNERTFQLITQVAGRAGRADMKGKVVLQTYSPQNPTLKFAVKYDYKSFFNKEISLRKATAFPPWSDIVRIMIEGDDDEKCLSALKDAYFKVKAVYDENYGDFAYFNKMRSPVKRIKNKYRYQVLMRVTDNRDKIEQKIYEVVDSVNIKGVNCYVEVNPGSMS